MSNTSQSQDPRSSNQHRNTRNPPGIACFLICLFHFSYNFRSFTTLTPLTFDLRITMIGRTEPSSPLFEGGMGQPSKESVINTDVGTFATNLGGDDMKVKVIEIGKSMIII